MATTVNKTEVFWTFAVSRCVCSSTLISDPKWLRTGSNKCLLENGARSALAHGRHVHNVTGELFFHCSGSLTANVPHASHHSNSRVGMSSSHVTYIHKPQGRLLCTEVEYFRVNYIWFCLVVSESWENHNLQKKKKPSIDPESCSSIFHTNSY